MHFYLFIYLFTHSFQISSLNGAVFKKWQSDKLIQNTYDSISRLIAAKGIYR